MKSNPQTSYRKFSRPRVISVPLINTLEHGDSTAADLPATIPSSDSTTYSWASSATLKSLAWRLAAPPPSVKSMQDW